MFVENVKLFCFGASYSVALASEAAGALVSAKLRRLVSLSFAAAGVLAHTIYLGHRAIGARICPLTTSYDSLLVLAWVLAVTCLTIQWHYPRVTVGVFALPLVVGLIGLAAFLGEDARRTLEGWARIWGPVHGALLAVGAVAVFVGFVAGVMYLVQVYRLKSKHLPSELLDLPSLELLERVNRQGIIVAFPVLTIGLGIGLLLAIEQQRAGNTEIRLADPKVIFGVLAWLSVGLLLGLRSQPQFRGRRVALLTIAAFGLLLFTIVGVDLLMSSWHRADSGASRGVRNLFSESEVCSADSVRDTSLITWQRAAGGAS